VAPSSHVVVVVACGCWATRAVPITPSHLQSHKQQKRGFEVLPNQCEIEKETTLNQDLTQVKATASLLPSTSVVMY